MGTSKPFLTVKTRHLYNKIYTLFNIYIMCWGEKKQWYRTHLSNNYNYSSPRGRVAISTREVAN